MSTVAPPVRKQKPQSAPGGGSDRLWLVIVKNDNLLQQPMEVGATRR